MSVYLFMQPVNVIIFLRNCVNANPVLKKQSIHTVNPFLKILQNYCPVAVCEYIATK
jgi:hypothetical protein